ncbi:MAG: DUF3147 family protein [Methylococcales bacterium]|nr:MAG: DUF3147 family protein [Methylococcales bacterium]
MLHYLLKIIISSLIIVAIVELTKRSLFWGAALASLPITSLLAFAWLYLDTGNSDKVATLSTNIFWLILPSLVLFITLPMLLRQGFEFWLSLAIATSATGLAYYGMVKLLGLFAIRL